MRCKLYQGKIFSRKPLEVDPQPTIDLINEIINSVEIKFEKDLQNVQKKGK